MKALKISLLALAGLLAVLSGGLQYYTNGKVADLQQTIAGQRAAFYKLRAKALEGLNQSIEANAQLKIVLGNIQAINAQKDAKMKELLDICDRLAAALKAKKADEAVATAARVTRGSYIPSQTSAPLQTITEPPARSGPSLDKISAAAAHRAESYFRHDYKAGSSATLAIDVSIDTDEPEPIPGWAGQYHVRGTGRLSFYDSLGSFSNATERFEVTVKTAEGSTRASDFHLILQ